jgi:ribulose-5-phosphate 4-epimerase/fuculose-1-phosphate aldolase
MNMRDELLQAATRLAAKGLFNDGGDSLSLLLPGTGRMLLLVHGQEPQEITLDRDDEGVAGLHARLYRLRGDVGAAALLSPRWSLQLQQLGEAMPSVFDEQARHIGRSWAPATVERLPSLLAGSGNAGPLAGRLLALGVTRNRMLFNAELFEKCAMAYVLARLGGERVMKVPWWVRLIAGRRLRQDQARAASSHAAGQQAAELGAY